LSPNTKEPLSGFIKIDNIMKDRDVFLNHSIPIFGNGYIRNHESGFDISNPSMNLYKRFPINLRGAFPVEDQGVICLGGTIVYFIDSALNERVLLSSKDVITACSIFPNNKYAIFGNLKGEICSVPIFEGRQKFSDTFLLHDKKINFILLDQSGRYLISTGEDNFLVIFDMQLKKEVFRHYLGDPYDYISLNKSNDMLLINKNNDYQIWKFDFENFDILPDFDCIPSKSRIELLRVNPFKVEEYKEEIK
jgi:WD40 repeat protein